MSKGYSMAVFEVLGAIIAVAVFLYWRRINNLSVIAEGKTSVAVYKKSHSGCCDKWVKHLQDAGFAVEVHNASDGDAVRDDLGVPPALRSCHTATVGGYVIEGHVPASDILRLLAEKPRVTGLAVPGMPEGSPGIEGPHPETYKVMAFSASEPPLVFAVHTAQS